VAPPEFCNRWEVRYRSVGGLEYEVPQKLTHLLQCTHILHNFWTSTHRGELPPLPPSSGATASHSETLICCPLYLSALSSRCRSCLEQPTSPRHLDTLSTSLHSASKDLPLFTTLSITVKCSRSNPCHYEHFTPPFSFFFNFHFIPRMTDFVRLYDFGGA